MLDKKKTDFNVHWRQNIESAYCYHLLTDDGGQMRNFATQELRTPEWIHGPEVRHDDEFQFWRTATDLKFVMMTNLSFGEQPDAVSTF